MQYVNLQHTIDVCVCMCVCVCVCACVCVRLQASQVYIMDRPVFFNFSTSQEITRSANHLLYHTVWYTLLHPLYIHDNNTYMYIHSLCMVLLGWVFLMQVSLWYNTRRCSP